MDGKFGDISVSTLGVLDFVGFVAFFTSAALVALRLVQYLLGRRRNAVAIGIAILTLLSVCLIFGDQLSRYLPEWFEERATVVRQVTAAFWWLVGAFTVNAAIGRYVWRSIALRERGIAIPKIVPNATAGFVYLIAALVIMHLVYEKPVAAIAATSGVVAFILGYSAQSTLAEIFAGLSIHLDQPFRKGDFVLMDGRWGTIEDLNWRSVRMVDLDGCQVTVPNSKVASHTVINYERPDPALRRTFDILIEFGTSPKRVQNLLVDAMRESRFVLDSPPPSAALIDFTDLGFKFEVRFWMNSFDHWWASGDEVGAAIWRTLKRNGIRFAYRRSQTFSPNDPDHLLLYAGDAGRDPDLATLLCRLAPFDQLTAAEIEVILPYACRQEYDWPERIVRQGDDGNSIFIIARGTVEVTLRYEDASEERMTMLGPGEAFGIMSLLTGEPRSANVRAREHVVVYEIAKLSIQKTLERRPEALHHIAAQVAEMRLENDRAKAGFQASRHVAQRQREELLSQIVESIGQFLGLKAHKRVNADLDLK